MPRLLVALIDDLAHFFIESRGGFARLQLAATLSRAAEKLVRLVLVVHDRAHLIREPPLGDHVMGQFRRTLDIVGGTGRDTVDTQCHLFSDATTKQRADLTNDLLT